MADGFHIDGDGNLWIGSTSTTFTTSAPFYVQTDGTIHAEQGDIGGLDIGSNFIQSSNYSVNNQAGYRLQSDGNAIFYGSLTANSLSATGANISGNITATDGTIGGTQINSSNIESTTFNNTTGYQIGANSATFHDVTITGTLSGANIDGTIDGAVRTASGNTYIELSSDSGSTIKFTKGGGDFGFIQDNSGEFDINTGVNANAMTLSTAVGPIKVVPANGIYIGGDVGSSSKVLVGGNSPAWSNVPATAGVTSIVTTPGNHITASNNTGTVNLVVNASNLGDSHNHTSTNAPGTTFSDANHGNNHDIDFSNVLNSSSNGGGNYHAHTTANVNQLTTSASSVLSLSNNSGSILINHYDNDHQNFANSGHGHDYASSNHGHSYASSNHGHDYAASSHGHGNSYVSNSHLNGHPTNHNHPYAASSHNHNIGEVSGHGNHSHNHDGTYAPAYHTHGNVGINPFTHDDRLLNIHSNTVPGLNVVQRMNPVTANFSTGYLESIQGAAHHLDSYDKLSAKTYRLTHQDVVQALTDDGIDPDDVAMVIPEVRYAKEHAFELNGEEMKGLMDGEIDAILVQAIKDLSAKIDLLEDRLATLEG